MCGKGKGSGSVGCRSANMADNIATETDLQKQQAEEKKLAAMNDEQRAKYLAEKEAEKAHDEAKRKATLKRNAAFGGAARKLAGGGGRGGRGGGGRGGAGRGGGGGRAGGVESSKAEVKPNPKPKPKPKPPESETPKTTKPATGAPTTPETASSGDSSSVSTPMIFASSPNDSTISTRKEDAEVDEDDDDSTPLPPNWELVPGDPYFYWNKLAVESRWTRPVAQPLEPGWKSSEDDAGRTYYYNEKTRETSWKEPKAAPGDWEERTVEGRKVFWNKATNESRWDLPS